eukprot:CAMPEP_0198208560 /NCGR_PEP_ID=MMETSP1445-20131203/11908_1 /TAXON_ID=36898 /ORGANISM="Pyramimonas sp., Strain CCMP2087" /LENGTH=410 /DNA_ID=CAMNT_0043881997 /DNA_START=345 /DNA_END=1577 /DNA_ORIENTATION=-
MPLGRAPLSLHLFFVTIILNLAVAENQADWAKDLYSTDLNGGLQPLDLCDCHFADDTDGASTNLACERDGFFIAGFRSAGYLSGRADQLLPLSPAICCRPCLPMNDTNKYVAIVTSDCHRAAVKTQEQCTHSSFLQGFEKSQRATPTSYYPYGSAQCCTPTLLLDSGEVKPLVRCLCGGDSLSPTHVSCAAQDDPAAAQAEGRLIYGFDHVHDIFGHFPVPGAHAECCRVCVDMDAQPQPSLLCENLNFCNGHGECMVGACKCDQGYAGETCSSKSNNSHSEIDANTWALSFVVLMGGMLGCCSRMVMCGCARLRRHTFLHNGAETTGGRGMEEALIGRGGMSSAEEWSTDSDDEDDDEDRPQPPPPQPFQPPPRTLQGAAQGGEGGHIVVDASSVANHIVAANAIGNVP